MNNGVTPEVVWSGNLSDDVRKTAYKTLVMNHSGRSNVKSTAIVTRILTDVIGQSSLCIIRNLGVRIVGGASEFKGGSKRLVNGYRGAPCLSGLNVDYVRH